MRFFTQETTFETFRRYSVSYNENKHGPIPHRVLKKFLKDNFSDFQGFYKENFPKVYENPEQHYNTYNQIQTEIEWHQSGRPYYNIWPGITKHLDRLNEDKVKLSMIRLPERFNVLAMQFSEQDESMRYYQQATGSYQQVRTVLMCDIPAKNVSRIKRLNGSTETWGSSSRMLYFVIDIGERSLQDGPIYTYKILDTTNEEVSLMKAREVEVRPKEKESFTFPEGEQTADWDSPTDVINRAVRICCSACLISIDSDDGLIFSDVLSKDRQKYAEAVELNDRDKMTAIEQRALKQGKFGFNVGQELTEKVCRGEVSPHYRNASPLALYWTGEGRKIPVYRYRKGTFVHKKQVTTLPTGYAEPPDYEP